MIAHAGANHDRHVCRDPVVTELLNEVDPVFALQPQYDTQQVNGDFAWRSGGGEIDRTDALGAGEGNRTQGLRSASPTPG